MSRSPSVAPNRRLFGLGAIAFAAAAMTGIAPSDARAQAAYPTKPITIIVPFSAGGTTDILARVVGLHVGQTLGQPVIVDNRAGAGGNIGTQAVARAPADGYTLLMGTVGTHAINQGLYKKLPFDPIKDFAPLSRVAMVPNLLVANPAQPYKNVKELIAYAKANPGKVNFASSGSGTSIHLSGELFKQMTQIDMQHVPYKGTALAMPDLISGQLDAMFDSISTAMPHVRDGRIRALAVTSAQRSPQAPDLPPVGETVPGFESTTWFGLYGPKALPGPIVVRLNTALNQLLKDPEVRERALRLGFEPAGGTPEQFAAVVAAQTAKWAKVIKDNRITIE